MCILYSNFGQHQNFIIANLTAKKLSAILVGDAKISSAQLRSQKLQILLLKKKDTGLESPITSTATHLNEHQLMMNYPGNLSGPSVLGQEHPQEVFLGPWIWRVHL